MGLQCQEFSIGGTIMADYYEQSRSNYCAVKDKAAFEKFLESFGLEMIEASKDKNLVGFLAPEGIPSAKAVPDEEGYTVVVDVDFVSEIANHLADDAVMIIVGNGYEAMRYLAGFACAFNNNGEYRRISIDDIYDLAKPMTSKPDAITSAAY
jgi:hypothetical protein